MYMSGDMGYVHPSSGVMGGQKRALDPWRWNKWCLGTTHSGCWNGTPSQNEKYVCLTMDPASLV